jgi:nucleoside-diphosphate-sugar epimerase
MEHMFEESMMTTHTHKIINTTCSKIVVFGGAGFIGNQLCRKLIDKGHHVIWICIDHNSLSASSISNPRFEYIHHNIVNPIELKDSNIRHIYNLACCTEQEDPLSTIKTCVIGTFNTIELAHKKGARLLLATTSDVHNRLAETIMVESGKAYGLDVRIARILNTHDETVSQLIDLMINV